MSTNHNIQLINDFNSTFDLDIGTNYITVKNNVAIAAAVTAYARIHMIPLKLMDGTIYSDTDSIITSDILSDNMIGILIIL